MTIILCKHAWFSEPELDTPFFKIINTVLNAYPSLIGCDIEESTSTTDNNLCLI